MSRKLLSLDLDLNISTPELREMFFRFKNFLDGGMQMLLLTDEPVTSSELIISTDGPIYGFSGYWRNNGAPTGAQDTYGNIPYATISVNAGFTSVISGKTLTLKKTGTPCLVTGMVSFLKGTT